MKINLEDLNDKIENQDYIQDLETVKYGDISKSKSKIKQNKKDKLMESLSFLTQGTCISICGHANCSHQCVQHQHFPCLPLKADVLYLINIRISRWLIDSSATYCTIFYVSCTALSSLSADILSYRMLQCTL